MPETAAGRVLPVGDADDDEILAAVAEARALGRAEALDVERLARAVHRTSACQHWLGQPEMCPMWEQHLDEAASIAREYAAGPHA